MTPREFALLLLGWVRTDPQVRARSFAEAGYSEAPCGVQVALPAGALVHLQCVGAFPAADPGPLHGSPPPHLPPVELPAQGPTELVQVERWVGWRITQAGSPLLAGVELFQVRPMSQRGVPYGVGVRCHNGDRVWVYLRHVTGAGRPVGSGPAWRVQPTV